MMPAGQGQNLTSPNNVVVASFPTIRINVWDNVWDIIRWGKMVWGIVEGGVKYMVG